MKVSLWSVLLGVLRPKSQKTMLCTSKMTLKVSARFPSLTPWCDTWLQYFEKRSLAKVSLRSVLLVAVKLKHLKNDIKGENKYDFGKISIFDTLLWLPVKIFWKTVFCKQFFTISTFGHNKTKTSRKSVKYLKNDHKSKIKHDFSKIYIFDTLVWLPVAIF